MADIATLGIKIENADVPKATASLDGLTVASAKSEAATQRLTRRMALLEIEARQMDADMSKGRLSLAGLAKTMGVSEAAAVGLGKAFGVMGAVAALGFIGRKTIEETIQAQNAMAQLDAAVRSTGGAAGRTVTELDALSVALQHQTTYSDEAVKGAESILLTFNKIRGTEFDDATRAVTDLAARMGGDLQGAALQVGKALQDPNTGLTALRRSGVSFTESQQRVIKALFDTGREAEAQRLILAELEKQYGGSAAAARDTLGGALAALKNAWGDLFEVSGTASQGTVDGINRITTSLEHNGLTMNSFVTNTVIGWNNISAAVQKANNYLSIDLTKGLGNELDRVRKLNEVVEAVRLEANKIATEPAKIGPGGGGHTATDTSDALAKQHQANQDMIRDAEQAADLAGLQGVAAERVRILYDAQNKILDAQRKLKGDILQETINAIHEEERLKLSGVDRAESLRAADDAIKSAKQQLDSMEEDLASKLSTSLSKVFGKDNPLRGLFESLTKDLLGIWIARFVEPAAAAMFSIDLASMGRPGAMGNGQGQGGVADASASMAPNPAWGIGASGLAGLGIGYGAGAAIGGVGGVGVGALGGAAAGFMMAGPVGAVVGGLTGLVGGLLGASKAAKEAAERLHEMQARAHEAAVAFHEQTKQPDSFDAARSAIEKDFRALWSQLIQANHGVLPEQYASVGGRTANSVVPTLDDFQQAIDDYNTLIARAKEAAALQLQQTSEDLQVRLLTAQGHDKEAAALRLQLDQEREREAMIKSFGDTIDPTEQATLTLLDQVHAQEKLAAATDAANKSALNMVEGYKLQLAVFGARAPGMPVGSFGSGSPIRPPTGRTESASGDLHVTVMTPSGDVLGKAVLKDFKRKAADQYGDSTRWPEIQ
jgi:hypothetical protein